MMLMLSRPDVRREDAALVRQRQHHVGAVLAGAEHHVDLVRRRVVAADHLVRLGREVDLVADCRESVRAAQRRQVDAVQFLAAGDVDHRERVARRVAAAIVRDERQLAVRGRLHLVRLIAGANRPQHLFRRRIDNRERPLFVQHQQRLRGREPRRRDQGDERRKFHR